MFLDDEPVDAPYAPVYSQAEFDALVPPELLYESIENSDDLCSSKQSDEYNFDNGEERKERDEISLDGSVGPICCRAQESCAGIEISYTSTTDEKLN